MVTYKCGLIISVKTAYGESYTEFDNDPTDKEREEVVINRRERDRTGSPNAEYAYDFRVIKRGYVD